MASMNFHFSDRDLQRLYVEDAGPLKSKFPMPVIEKFFGVMNAVAYAVDERDLRGVGGFHFEKLKGGYEGCYSMRVNQQYRLVFRLKDEEDGTQMMEVLDLVDYH